MKRKIMGYSGFIKNNSGYRAYGRLPSSKHTDIFSFVSLVHGTGCTHMSIALANYMARVNRDEEIALVVKKEDALSDFIKNHVAPRVVVLVNGDKRTEEYRYRVYDVGVVMRNGEPVDDLMDRSSDTVGQRFVMCNDNEDYYYELDKYTRASNRSKGFVYLFNRLPKSAYKRVEDVMVEYSYNFLPPFAVDKLEDVAGLFELYVGA